MDVSVIGKALTPVPYPSESQFAINSSLEVKYERSPCSLASKCHSDIKIPLKVYFGSQFRHQETMYAMSDNRKSKLYLNPILDRNVSSETCSSTNFTPIVSGTPILAFNNSIESDAIVDKTAIEANRLVTPNACVCRTPKSNTVLCKHEGSKGMQDENKVKLRSKFMETEHKKQRKISSSTRKTACQNNKNFDKGNSFRGTTWLDVPPDFTLKNERLPPQTSVNSTKNIFDANRRRSEFSLFSESKSSKSVFKNYAANSVQDKMKSLAISRMSAQNGVRNKSRDDGLLSSLDAALSKKSKRHLSMRIQLIHRFGDENIITKRMELRKKQEAADKHERKNLEIRANEQLKEQQRIKIYALNALMTKLEQEKFEEYRQSLF